MRCIYYTGSLQELMATPLPPKYIQKRLPFRPTLSEVQKVYRTINRNIFDNQLVMPEIIIKPRCRKYWGMCCGKYELQYTGSWSYIILMDKWFCIQWMIDTLAHEMCHQYQWDIDGIKREKEGKNRLMSHGVSFFQFRDRLAEHDISLKIAHGKKRWFKHQDLFRC